jgi:CubicO group peptidase (beta-lactamase class C family)
MTRLAYYLRIVAGLILPILLFGCVRSTSSRNLDLNERIRRFESGFPVLSPNGILSGGKTNLDERMGHYYVPGVSIAVINDYEIDWAKGYGVVDANGNKPVSPDTLFPSASIGKALTAVAAMRYVELGLLELDRSVNDLLVSWKIPENEFTTQEDVTLGRLLSHTAGMSVSGFKGYFQGEEIPTLQQVLGGEPPSTNPPIRVERLPGTQYSYSGGGYQVAEQLLIDVSEKSFPAIMQESILDPVGMTSTTYAVELPIELRANAASAHGRWGRPIVGKWLNAPYMGAGASWTTPTDLARFAAEVMLAISGQSNLILSPEMANRMIAPQVEDIPFIGPFSMDWGLGWQLNRVRGEQYISHGGDIPEGYQHLLVAIPERGWGAVIMTNGANGDSLRLEILYNLAVLYGILPSLRSITFLAYLLLLLIFILIVLAITFLIRRSRIRKPVDAEKRNRTKGVRAFIASTVITAVVVSIIFYVALAFGLDSIAGPPIVGLLQAEALGKVEQGGLFADHGMIEQALASFTEAQRLDPQLEISASSWNHLCIRGSVWGYAADVMDACELATSLAPKDDGMLFGRGLARAIASDYTGAIEDFELYVEWTKDNRFYDPYGMEVEGFIIELKAGRNPFDEAQLDVWR